jgi:hypothetical protein
MEWVQILQMKKKPSVQKLMSARVPFTIANVNQDSQTSEVLGCDIPGSAITGNCCA